MDTEMNGILDKVILVDRARMGAVRLKWLKFVKNKAAWHWRWAGTIRLVYSRDSSSCAQRVKDVYQRKSVIIIELRIAL